MHSIPLQFPHDLFALLLCGFSVLDICSSFYGCVVVLGSQIMLPR